MKRHAPVKPFFIRNMAAGFLFQIFLVAAVSTILLTRAYLSLAGYPQVGGGSLHIAHVLWGGLLMLAASLVGFVSLSWRSTLLAAGLSGVGFGLFIDEVGKFLTKDNDYFFRPASVVMYLVFLLLVLLFQHLSRSQIYTDEERSVNAMRLLEQMFSHDLQASEKALIIQLLSSPERTDPQAAALSRLVANIPEHRIAPQNTISARLEKIRLSIEAWGRQRQVQSVMVAILTILAVVSTFVSINSLVTPTLPDWVAASGTVVILGLVATGIFQLHRDTRVANEWFTRALVFDFLVVEPFLFYSEQFVAAYGLVIKLALWLYFANLTSDRSRIKDATTSSADVKYSSHS